MLHFDYVEPTSLEEAASALCARGIAGTIIAGGTDVLVQVKERKLAVDLLVSVAKIPGLRFIDHDAKRVNIGAMTTISEIETSGFLRRSVPILSDAVDEFGSVQTRNVATLGGNLCNASPAADGAPALLALNAEVTYRNGGEIKTRNLQQFFVSPGKTVLGRGDILTTIRFEKPRPRSGGAYLKLSARNGMDLPLLGIAVQLQVDQAGSRCEEVSVALGAAAPTPIRATGAEKILKGERLTEEILAHAADQASREARPRDDFRCSAEYRRAMIRNLLPEAIKRALSRIRQGTGVDA